MDADNVINDYTHSIVLMGGSGRREGLKRCGPSGTMMGRMRISMRMWMRRSMWVTRVRGAAVPSDRGKDNIDTSPRSSSSHPPDPAPQSRPADLRNRTLHPRNPRPLPPPLSLLFILLFFFFSIIYSGIYY